MLLSPAEFHALVSGQRRGARAQLARAALRVAETPYALAMRIRNWRYDSERATIQRLELPIISVGNLTLGGTGKTPMVAWLARWMRQRHLRVAIVSRGYQSGTGGVNDEALELEELLPDVPHLQDADRAAAAHIALEELEMQAIILDDGFQHRRLARDLDIVLVDALEPFGFGHVFPRGALREPLSGLARADVVAVTRCDLVSRSDIDAIRRQVDRLSPDALWLETRHAPQALRSAEGNETAIDSLREKPIAAFCGIGNPQGFRRTLESCGLGVADLKQFPDHHRYDRRDIEELGRWAGQQPVEAIVCTHKDLVKIGLTELGGKPLWALRIGLEILVGEAELSQVLGGILPASADD